MCHNIDIYACITIQQDTDSISLYLSEYAIYVLPLHNTQCAKLIPHFIF